MSASLLAVVPGVATAQDPCPEADFTDRASIPEVHLANVDCAVAEEIVLGRTDGSFGPQMSITRAQVAAFLARTLESAGVALPAAGDHGFADIEGSVHEENIARIAASGITVGTSATTFSPHRQVTREQVASFLLRMAAYALERDLSEMAGGGSPFTDIADSAHRENIEGAYNSGLMQGRTETEFRPSLSLTRAQMATTAMNWLAEFGMEPGWHPSELEETVPAGGYVSVPVTLVTEDGHDGVTFETTGDLDGFVTVAPEQDGELEAGRNQLEVALFAPRDGETGSTLEGTVAARSGGDQIGDDLSVTIEMADADPDAINTVTLPLPNELEETEEGFVAMNQIVMAPDEGVVDADYGGDAMAAAQAIAERHDAEVIGSSPSTGIFQLLVDRADTLDDLRAVWEAVAADAEVEFAGPRTLDAIESEHPVATPDDAGWDSWDEDAPAGNNWHLEVTKAPSAWARQTGSDTVKVAIIDGDFDPDHEDLSFTAIEGTRHNTNGHGTHVAGTACADGDNGIGISGVAWDCDLYGYEIGVPHSTTGIDALQAMEYMVQAAEDGAQVANMSFGTNVGCAGWNAWSEASAETRRNQYSRAVARAQGHNDVLWVAAAGNNACDVDLYQPAGLTRNFPTVFMSVAATNQAGAVSNFSNFGGTTTVAAPGGQTATESIFSTLPGNLYGGMRGTSMAAPHVTGAAALMFSANPDLTAAQARQCLRGSTQHGRQLADVDFNEINVDWAVACAEGSVDDPIIGLPEDVDLVFSVDLTGSMGGVVSTVQEEIVDALDRVQELAPGTAFTFGLTTYEDYPGTYDSRGCADSSYSATYGAADDRPFRLDEALTTDTAAMQAAVDGMTLGSGSDGPESYGRALWEHAQPDTGAALGWRDEAMHVVVMFGDNVPHDHDLHRGWEGDGLEVPAGLPQDTGYDPGRGAEGGPEPWDTWGEIECGGGSDIDFYDDALQSMQDTDTRLLYINNSFSTATQEAWRFWASMTGGAAEEISAGGGIDHEDGLGGLLVDLLAAMD